MFNVPQDKIDRGIYWSHGCNVIEGCTPVSEGCDNCWAAAMAHQYKRDFSKITVHLDRLERKVRMKQPQVFSLWNDVCHPEVMREQYFSIYRTIDFHQQHTFLILTKRPESIRTCGSDPFYHVYPKHPPNLWIGTTAENQELADKRIPDLLKCGSRNLFLSLEPLLGPMEIAKYLSGCCVGCGRVILKDEIEEGEWHQEVGSYRQPVYEEAAGGEIIGEEEIPYPVQCGPIQTTDINWVIVGCETGPNRRPCDPDWIRSIVRQCQAADVPCFVKAVNANGRVLKRWDEPGFPDDLKVRNFPACTAFEVEDADGR